MPSTKFGEVLWRLNSVASDLSLLTRQLNDGRGRLNPNGTLQKLVLQSELHDNWNRMALTATEAFTLIRPVLTSFRVFAEKVARDPSSMTRGALQRQ